MSSPPESIHAIITLGHHARREGRLLDSKLLFASAVAQRDLYAAVNVPPGVEECEARISRLPDPVF